MWKISEEVTRLKEFLENAAIYRAGQIISYDEITDATDVPMNVKGKGYLRNAARYCGVEFSTIPKQGIEIAGPDNSAEIMGGRLARIDSATRRSETAAKNISARYLEDMSDHDKSSITMLVSILGAIRASTDQYKRVRKAKQKQAIRLVNTI